MSRIYVKHIVCCRDCPDIEHSDAGWYCERTGHALFDPYDTIDPNCPLQVVSE
jgi:hypothetical protein